MEALIRAKTIKYGIDSEIRHPYGMIVIGGLKPRESLLLVAVAFVRWQTSPATSCVSRVSGGSSIKRSVSAIRSPETMLREGDTSSCAEKPWRSVPRATLLWAS